MAYIPGLSGGIQAVQPPPAAGAPVGIPPAPDTPGSVVVDGTPVRVAVLALSAALGLTALKMAGFKFNVAVSGS